MDYKYFLRKFGDYYSEIYRMPNNGKKIIDNMYSFEKYIPKGKWSNESKDLKGVFEDEATGYFSEKRDEVTEVKALAIMKKLDEAIQNKV